MRIFTSTRSPSQSPERRVPVISAPFDFHHEQQGGLGDIPIAATIGFQHVQHANVGAKIAKPISAKIGFQQHASVGAGMKSISQVINTQAPEMPSSRRDLNGSPVAKVPIQSDDTMKKLMNRKTHIHMGMNPSVNVPSPKHLRSVLSTPELRDSDIPQNIARLRPVLSRQAESGTSRRRSWFTVTTEIIEGRRTLIRKVLDTLGCTKADQFNIYEFEPVKPPARTVVQAFRSTERELSQSPRRPSSLSLSKTRVTPTNVVPRAR